MTAAYLANCRIVGHKTAATVKAPRHWISVSRQFHPDRIRGRTSKTNRPLALPLQSITSPTPDNRLAVRIMSDTPDRRRSNRRSICVSPPIWRRCTLKHAVAEGARREDQRSNGKKLPAGIIQLCLPILVTSVDGFPVCQVPLWRLETSLPCIRCSGEGEHIRLTRMAFRSEETRPNGLGLHAGIEWNRVRRRIRIIERPCSRLCHSLASYCLQCLLRGNVSTVTENSTFNFCYPRATSRQL